MRITLIQQTKIANSHYFSGTEFWRFFFLLGKKYDAKGRKYISSKDLDLIQW